MLLATPVWAALEVIKLRHRSAEDVLPIIRPLLDKGDVASGMNYQLILRTSPQNLEQVKKLLESIDVAPRRLKITVMQNADSETVARLTGMSGNIGLSREARVAVPDSGGGSGLNVELGQGQDRLKARVSSTRALEDERNTQHCKCWKAIAHWCAAGNPFPCRNGR